MLSAAKAAGHEVAVQEQQELGFGPQSMQWQEKQQHTGAPLKPQPKKETAQLKIFAL